MKSLLLGTQSDEHLLALARLGSEEAFESLVSRYRRSLRRHCRRLCLSDAAAEVVLQRTLSEAWSGISDGVEFDDLHGWMRQIAQQHAVEAMRQPGSRPVAEHLLDGDLALRDANGAGMQQAPRPDEVLALRGALAAMSPRDPDRSTIVTTRNGNKAHVPGDPKSEIVGAAFRGLIGRTRRGISALTPAPLLSWAIGRAGQGSSTVAERLGEVGASGGSAGLTGLAIKGGIAAIGAGVAITGSVMIAKPSGSHVGAHHRHHSAGSLVAARPSPGADEAIVRSPSTLHLHQGDGPHSSEHRSAGSSKSTRGTRRQTARGTQQVPAATVPAAHTSPTSTHTGVQRDLGSGHQNTAGAGTQTPAVPTQGGGAPSTTSTTTSTSSSSGGDGNSQGEGQGAEGQGGNGQGGNGQGGNGQGGNSQGGESGSGTTSGQSAPIGVHVSVESGSSGDSSTGSSSGNSESQGVGVGVSISLGPVGEVGVHVSLP